MAAAKEDQKNPIQVIARMMKLLDVLAGHPEPLGLKQVAQYTGLHPSTAHRILSALAADRLVDRVEPGSYRLGMRLLELGNLVKSRINVREMALPVMRELHSQTGETVNLSVRHDDEIVYVERTSSGRSAMRVVHVIGARAPLHVTAAGKLFLLEDGFARLREYAKRTGLAPHSKNSLTSLAVLEARPRTRPAAGLRDRQRGGRDRRALRGGADPRRQRRDDRGAFPFDAGRPHETAVGRAGEGYRRKNLPRAGARAGALSAEPPYAATRPCRLNRRSLSTHTFSLRKPACAASAWNSSTAYLHEFSVWIDSPAANQ